MWDEKTNTLYVPASKVYADMGAYSPKMMQLNALAHELTHYHLNGFALKDGGDFGKVPLWFREGLAEYGAHAFYKEYMDSSALSAYLGNATIPRHQACPRRGKYASWTTCPTEASTTGKPSNQMRSTRYRG